MKKIFKITVISFIALFYAGHPALYAQTQEDSIIFNENFELQSKPANWTYEYVDGNIEWQYQEGGYTTNPDIEGSGHPPYAFQGEGNAMFHYASYSGETTKLVTPPIDLKYAVKPELIFWHAQDERESLGEKNNDELRLYTKKSGDSNWTLLKTYTELVKEWTKRQVLLPDSILSEDFYLAFEGKTKNGYGTCIDSVTIVERGIASKYIDEINYRQPVTDFVPTNSNKNRIMRIDFAVGGNDGTLELDSIGITSLNTDDNNITENGVKLFASSDTLFVNSQQIASGIGFTNGKAIFDNLNYDLPVGLSSVWITYDIMEDVDHTLQNNIVDAKIKANAIKINNDTYPLINKSPLGERKIFESIFYDNFENDKNWALTGEFERNQPQGLGGSIGSPDPTNAPSGQYVLGTDLSGLGSTSGDYEFDLTEKAYKATSPMFDCFYYQDIYLYLDRWLNVDGSDKVYLEISHDNGNTWETLWENNSTRTADNWSNITYDLKSYINRVDSVRVRFSLGPTDGYWNFSGWNIDNIFFTGDYISQDVSITDWIAPLQQCQYNGQAGVRVKVKNFGGDPTRDTIPLVYSFDGGETEVRDTVFQSIPVGDSLVHTFSTPVDLNQPALYENVYAKTALPSDEVEDNDRYNYELLILPTYKPPYEEDFENTPDYFWQVGGENKTWTYTQPVGSHIDTAASGRFVWVTDSSFYYPNNDSTFLESPCFNFSDMKKPVFEFKMMTEFEKGKDGFALYYSIDDGVTWILVPKQDTFKWNWYNSDNIAALGTAGWDTTTSSWTRARQVLPSELEGQSQVKFRFLMESDEITQREGAAIDDIKIYEAPPDVGVSTMPWPESQCELSDAVYPEVYITNFGIDTLFAGDSIPIALKQQDNAFIKDTLVLSSFLEPGDSVQYTFKDSLDMSYSGDYPMKIYTHLENDPFFYSENNNDTLARTISVLGMPRYDIGYIIGTPPPVDTTLDAGAGYSSYNWNTGATTQTIDVTSTGWYKVTVTNDNSCSATDSVKVVDSEINTGITQIITSIGDACTHPNPLEYTVEVSNMGLTDLNAGDTIPMAYQINEQEPVADTMFLSGSESLTTTAPDSTIQFSFAEKLDLSEPGTYELKFYTNFSEDYDRRDDTATTTVNTWGYPDTELRYDTLLTTQADTLTLDAGSGFDSYQWQDGSSSQTFNIQHNRSQWYKVVVTDIHGCGDDADSTHVIASDIGIDSLVHPLNSCEFTSSEQAVVRIRNHSADTLLAGSIIPVGLHVNGTAYNDNVSLADSIMPGGYSNVTLDPVFDISAPGAHQFRVYTSITPDANHSNDTLQKEIHTWGYPDVELARDTIYTTQADTVEFSAGSGFDSYTWQDGSGGEIYEVSKKYSALYKVTVSDAHGCGTDSDSTQIFTYDLGISEMTSPKSDCELSDAEPIRIKVKNFSSDTLKSGDKIPMGYQVEGGPLNRDTLTLADMLLPGNSISHTFSQKADLSNLETTYRFDIFVDHPHDANMSNDTLLDAVKTFGYPEFSLNYDTLVTTQADTVKLFGDIDENAYLWQDGTNTDTFYVDRNTTETYHLTVTDLNGCSWRDTTEVITYDLAVDSIINPVAACEHGSAESLTIQVKNNGQDTLLTGRALPLGYRFNGSSNSYEDHMLVKDLHPDSTFSHTFGETFDMTGLGTYEFTAFSAMSNDARRANDTMRWNADHYGYPQVDLGPDTLFTNQADTITLEAPPGYDSYLWQDGSTGETFSITSKASRLYHVTVTNDNGCSVSDSVRIIATDIEMLSVLTPQSGCGLGHQEEVTVELYNNSASSIPGGETFTLTLITPQGTIHDDVMNLSNAFQAGDTLEFTYTRNVDLSLAQTYELEVYVDYEKDFTGANDTIRKNIEALPTPRPDLGPDTSVTAGEYTLDPGAFTQYLWHDGSQKSTFTITAQNTTADSLYYVEVTNEAGCKASDTVKVGMTVYDLSISAIASPGNLCRPQNDTTVSFTLENTGNQVIPSDSLISVAYQLDNQGEVEETINLSSNMLPEDSMIYEFSDKISLQNSGSYDFTLSTSTGGDMVPSNNDTTFTFEVYPLPDLDLGEDTLNTELPYTLDPGNFEAYEWQDGSTSSTYEVQQPGTYSLTVFNQYGCSDYDEIVVTDATDIDLSAHAGYSATIYPNPAQEYLIVELEAEGIKSFTLRLVSTQGHLVQNRKASLENGRIRLDTRNLARGIYYLTIATDQHLQTRKVIIK
ncbi:MAG: T9SS type A sorting domain-containing protein [Bacteroidales bacterium]|nr:T9SS type A sorting domain-containing protein [Bacteroidales bacterium]